MTRKDRKFPSARQDAEAAERQADHPQTRSSSYRLAFADREFLLRDELRAVRLQLELMKADLALQEAGIESTVVVFGSARSPVRPALSATTQVRLAEDYEQARRLGHLVSEAEPIAGKRFVIATGGGGGIMEAANRGALDAGAKSIGFNIVLPTEQIPNPYITPELCFQFHYFAVRKMHLLMRAVALVCFPGGFGTMDELFETLTLAQSGKVGRIPVLLFRQDWWKRIIDFEALAEEGMIAKQDLTTFRYVESADQAWSIIKSFYEDEARANP